MKEMFDMLPNDFQMLHHVGHGGNGTSEKLAAPAGVIPPQS